MHILCPCKNALGVLLNYGATADIPSVNFFQWASDTNDLEDTNSCPIEAVMSFNAFKQVTTGVVDPLPPSAIKFEDLHPSCDEYVIHGIGHIRAEFEHGSTAVSSFQRSERVVVYLDP